MDNHKDDINVVRNVEPFEEDYSDEITPRRSNPMLLSKPGPKIRFGPPPINPYDYDDTAQPYGFRNWFKQLLTSSEELTGTSSSSEEWTAKSYLEPFDQEEAKGSYFHCR